MRDFKNHDLLFYLLILFEAGNMAVHGRRNWVLFAFI